MIAMTPIETGGEKLINIPWASKKSPHIKEIPNIYYYFSVNLYPEILKREEEIGDDEIMNLPEKIGMFSFLNNEEEDIYSKSDGVPLE